MDMKEMTEKRRDVENLRRKRKEEKKRILSSPYLSVLMFFHSNCLSCPKVILLSHPGLRDQRRKQKKRLKEVDE